MLFVEGVQELYLIYVISAGLIALGIGLIVKYFVTESYRNMHDYSFSGGTLVVILGCVVLVRASQLLEKLSVFVGLLVLAAAVSMLQQALQLHITGRKVWTVVIVISAVTLLASFVLLFDLGNVPEKINNFSYMVLLFAGVMTLLCMVISGIGVHVFLRQEKDEAARMQQEQREAFAREEEQRRLEKTMKTIESRSQEPTEEKDVNV
jgi:amino acid transporter